MSSLYDNSPWPTSARQSTWDASQVPSRSGSNSVNRAKTIPFYHQLEEVGRAIENLRTNSKAYSIPPNRRESIPMMPRRPFGPEYVMTPNRPYSISEFDATVSNQGSVTPDQLYTQQRYNSRPADGDPQAKRRAAAARERELRNYHQEQQYNRNIIPDISNSKVEGPGNSSLPEEESRQHQLIHQHPQFFGESPAL